MPAILSVLFQKSVVQLAWTESDFSALVHKLVVPRPGSEVYQVCVGHNSRLAGEDKYRRELVIYGCRLGRSV